MHVGPTQRICVEIVEILKNHLCGDFIDQILWRADVWEFWESLFSGCMLVKFWGSPLKQLLKQETNFFFSNNSANVHEFTKIKRFNDDLIVNISSCIQVCVYVCMLYWCVARRGGGLYIHAHIYTLRSIHLCMYALFMQSKVSMMIYSYMYTCVCVSVMLVCGAGVGYIHIYTCIHTKINRWIMHTHIQRWTDVWICSRVCMLVCGGEGGCLHIDIEIHPSVYVCMHYSCMHVSLCMYLCIYMYVCMYIYVYA